MNWPAVVALLAVALTAEYVWLRPTARAALHRALYQPLRRRARSASRTLAALHRAASFRPYRGHHTPPRRTQP
ncbi:hypothetical protein ABZW11_17000 [Nonomuraea sp. NPDC004580]|uniref:hypothetical protein n=1 Tax=Nonomuraea sp. NPDC004580 TaxID=3154552 RepID=UPI0033B7C2D9